MLEFLELLATYDIYFGSLWPRGPVLHYAILFLGSIAKYNCGSTLYSFSQQYYGSAKGVTFINVISFRSYEAEVAYLEIKSEKTTSSAGQSFGGSSRGKAFWSRTKKSERVICRAKCKVCNTKPVHVPTGHVRDSKWVRSKGQFLSVGAAVISNRNERAPDGLVADAHLSDGFLHLILIKDCPHALYLW